jgi:hypothetical protein
MNAAIAEAPTGTTTILRAKYRAGQARQVG